MKFLLKLALNNGFAMGFLIVFLHCGLTVKALDLGEIRGKLKSDQKVNLSYAVIRLEPGNHYTVSDEDGRFNFKAIPFGTYSLTVSHLGFKTIVRIIELAGIDFSVEINMQELGIALDEVEILSMKKDLAGYTYIGNVSGAEIFSAKKSDVILLDKINANLALNNSRETFAKVSGLNIWENDGSGIQMNISVRGLSPNRSWEMNNRQNGYNIQADVLGYPDTYYTPPLEAVESIELVRGAASLSYGTQMGGMVNYKLKKSTGKQPFEMESTQTRGSYNLFSSYNGFGGNYKKIRYYGYHHHRSADGWRKNGDYKWNTAYASIGYDVNSRISLTAEMTYMKYLLHLSAGLTDSLFKVDPRQSLRDRNWFQAQWLLPALILDYKISPWLKLNIRNCLLVAKRNSVEFTLPMNIVDDNRNRDLRKDTYLNFTSEARLLGSYNLSFMEDNALNVGVRFYKGNTTRGQGLGTNGADANFTFINPTNLEYHDYSFFTTNMAFYVENLFKITNRLSFTPGFRYEWIDMNANGYYNSGGQRSEEKDLRKVRRISLFGVGMQYDINKQINLYSNYSQGYRAINFNDIRITNPNLLIDNNLKDSKGANIDLGVRGSIKDYLRFDWSIFLLEYNNKIGIETRKDSEGKEFQYSTNISNSRNMGLESMVEFDILRYLDSKTKNGLSFYINYSYIEARYLSSANKDIKNKTVESAPINLLRSGLTLKVKNFSTTVNYSLVSKQFSDANNTQKTITGSNGIIPQYELFDWSSSYKFKSFKLGASINNIMNKKYFTRRATSYPGPGLIPGEPQIISLSLSVKI